MGIAMIIILYYICIYLDTPHSLKPTPFIITNYAYTTDFVSHNNRTEFPIRHFTNVLITFR